MFSVNGIARSPRFDQSARKRMGERQTAVLETEPAHQNDRLDRGLEVLGQISGLGGGQRGCPVGANSAIASVGDRDSGAGRPRSKGSRPSSMPARFRLELL